MHAWNPPNRFHTTEVEWEEPPPPPKLEIIEDRSRGIISENNSPDVGFDSSVNPYRGCTHGCAYCYARPTHEYLGWGAGSDFDRKILVKLRAPELLREAFDHRSWEGKEVVFSGVTDCYQPVERKYELTRGCLEVCADYCNPAGIITRSPLITRDLEVLQRLAAFGGIKVTFSIPIADPELQRKIEPGAPPPEARFRAMRTLSDAGIPVGVSVSPVIPGINESLVPESLQRARDAGARWAWSIDLRLPGAVAQVFEHRIREALPLRAGRVMNGVRRMRSGELNDSRFGSRMRGSGSAALASRQLFELWREKLGFEAMPPAPWPSPFRRPGAGCQLKLL